MQVLRVCMADCCIYKSLEPIALLKSSIMQPYSNLFKVLASYAIEEYAIKLKHGAASYALHTVHRVAIPLSKKVEKLL